jgi:uncharacterized repeat protein (TIGR03803 family)
MMLAAACASAQSPSLEVLYQFGRGPNEVTAPDTTLVEFKPGLFVGSYSQGLFSITSAGEFNVVSDFHNAAYFGTGPGPLTPASNGFLYGEAYNSNAAYGIYRVGRSGQVTFLNENLQTIFPLIEGSDGNLWGTQGSPTTGFSAFKMSFDGTLTTVSTSLESAVSGPLLLASDGNYYGATGTLQDGTPGQIFRLTPSGEYTLMYTFPPGEGSSGGLIEASNGLLYGTALYSVDLPCPHSGGEVFSISLAGSFKTLGLLLGCGQGLIIGPEAGLLEASNGMLYGSTTGAGLYTDGTIFQIGLDGSNFKNVWMFQGADGEEPLSEGPAVIQGSDGNLYGTTYAGGAGQGGTVFKLELGLTPPLPKIQLIQPRAAAPGTTIRLKGNYLLGLSEVSFNGVSAAFTPVNVNYADAVVPAGATTGPITVTTPNGSSTTKMSFKVD